jgi:nitrogenase subunit NifH
VSREQTDKLIATVREQVLEMIAKADKVASGEIKPTTITRHPHSKKAMEFIPFAEATVYEQRDAIRALEWNFRRNAEMGTSFANMMSEVAD